jgi:hypothetical protein
MTAPLAQWIDHAQHALDHEPVLTRDHILALLATPDAPGRLRDGVTWYLEEATRQLRAEAFEHRAAEPQERRALEARAERRTARVELLLAQHAEAIRLAHGFAQQARGLPAAGPTESYPPLHQDAPRRLTAAERALRARTESLSPQDAAA